MKAPPQPERSVAKLWAACLLLCTLLVLAWTPEPQPAPKAKVAAPERSYDTVVERLWHEHREDIEDAALAALLGL